MARRESNLSQGWASSPSTEGRDYVRWDHVLPGFGVRVRAGGSKVFVVKFRTASGQQRWLTIGSCAAIPLADRKDASGRIIEPGARTLARQAMAAAAAGEDPAAKRDAAKAVPTVSEAAAAFLAWGTTRAIRPWKAKTAYEYRRLVENKIVPNWGRLRLDEVTRKKVEAYQARHADTEYETNRVLQTLGFVFRFAIDHGLWAAGADPTRAVQRFSEEARRCRLQPEQIRAVNAALRRAENSHPDEVAALRLAMLTGARRSEVASLEWGWVDLEAGLARLPDDKSRRRGDKREKKTLVLSEPALALLRPRWSEGAKGRIFGSGAASTFYHDLGDCWERVRQDSGVVGEDGRPLRIHDLRHAYAAAAVDAEMDRTMVRDLLGHQDIRSTDRYMSARDSTKLRLGSRVSGAIADAMNG